MNGGPVALPLNREQLAEQMHALNLSFRHPYGMPLIPPLRHGISPVQGLANETLSEIFVCIMKDVHYLAGLGDEHFPPYGKRVLNRMPVIQPVMLSHVCRRWRAACLETSELWTDIRIWHTNHSEVWSDILSRSARRDVDVEIFLPNHNSIELWDRVQVAHIKEVFKAIRASAPRMRNLSMHCPNPTLRILINDALEEIHFEKLKKLHVSQAGQQQLCFFGPMSFNEEFFRTLNLYGVMIDCSAKCLKNLDALSLVGSSGTVLDQEKLSHLSYPAIPPGPTMEKLKTLIVVGTYPIPIQNRELIPSFDISTLTYLQLSQLRVPATNVWASVACLFRMICHAPSLEGLTLEAFDSSTCQTFVAALQACHHKPQYPKLKFLVFRHIDATYVTAEFLGAFPAVQYLRLAHTSPHPFSHFLVQDPTLCPNLGGFVVDDRHYGRNLAPILV